VLSWTTTKPTTNVIAKHQEHKAGGHPYILGP
jgi:hypothetical protein